MSRGTLYVVGTPLGNLSDLSARVIEVLRAVPVVAAEDTRRTRGMLHAIAAHPERREEMIRRSGRTTVPQIWIEGRHVGGFDDLSALEESGELDRLLGGAQ